MSNSLGLSDSDYEFLANCSDQEFHNWCIRKEAELNKQSGDSV